MKKFVKLAFFYSQKLALKIWMHIWKIQNGIVLVFYLIKGLLIPK